MTSAGKLLLWRVSQAGHAAVGKVPGAADLPGDRRRARQGDAAGADAMGRRSTARDAGGEPSNAGAMAGVGEGGVRPGRQGSVCATVDETGVPSSLLEPLSGVRPDFGRMSGGRTENAKERA
jgi:hypothetical protein